MRKFKKAYIEITNVCNLSCSFCPKTKRKPMFMDLILFDRILSEIKGSVNQIYLHVLGEPLLHPKLEQFLSLAGKYDLKVNITTNGTLIEKVKEIFLSGQFVRQINISLHSFEANTNICSVDNYLKSIFNFIDEALIKTKISFTMRLWNLGERAQNEENKHILRSIEKHFSLPYKIEEALSPVNGIRLKERVFINQSSIFEWPAERSEELESRGFCHGLRDQIAFLADGTVIPCCLDSEGAIVLGNISEQSFKDIVEGERASNIYDAFSNRNVIEPLCRKCSYRLKFNRNK